MDTDNKILEKYIKDHTLEVLRIIEKLSNEEIIGLFKSISAELSALLISKMDRFKAARCLETIDLEIAIKLISSLNISSTALILRQIEENLRNSIVDGLSIENSKLLRQILKYPDNSVGAYLDPVVFTLYEDLSIGQGLERIKESHPHVGSHVFILSRNQSLVGFIDLKELITGDLSNPIRKIMNNNPPKILAEMDIKVLLKEQAWDELFTFLPVVNLQGIFLGVIRKKTLSEIKAKEKTSDYHAKQASIALGDLYQIGFSSLIRSASEII